MQHSVALFAMSAAGGGINIDIDMTFVLQMALFMALTVALKPVLFDPMLRVFEAREARTEGARGSAREMQQQAGDLLTRYEAEIRRVNATAASERERIRLETAKLEAEILAEARAATAEIVEQGRGQIEQQVREIRADLVRRSHQLARDIASSALGREIQ